MEPVTDLVPLLLMGDGSPTLDVPTQRVSSVNLASEKL